MLSNFWIEPLSRTQWRYCWQTRGYHMAQTWEDHRISPILECRIGVHAVINATMSWYTRWSSCTTAIEKKETDSQAQIHMWQLRPLPLWHTPVPLLSLIGDLAKQSSAELVLPMILKTTAKFSYFNVFYSFFSVFFLCLHTVAFFQNPLDTFAIILISGLYNSAFITAHLSSLILAFWLFLARFLSEGVFFKPPPPSCWLIVETSSSNKIGKFYWKRK